MWEISDKKGEDTYIHIYTDICIYLQVHLYLYDTCICMMYVYGLLYNYTDTYIINILIIYHVDLIYMRLLLMEKSMKKTAVKSGSLSHLGF